MLSGLASYCMVSVAYIEVESVPGLLLVRVLHGMAAALVIPAANAYVEDLAPKQKEDTYTGFFLVSFLSGVIYKHWGIDPVFYVCAGFLLAAAVYGFFFLQVFPLNPADNRVKF